MLVRFERRNQVFSAFRCVKACLRNYLRSSLVLACSLIFIFTLGESTTATQDSLEILESNDDYSHVI